MFYVQCGTKCVNRLFAVSAVGPLRRQLLYPFFFSTYYLEWAWYTFFFFGIMNLSVHFLFKWVWGGRIPARSLRRQTWSGPIMPINSEDAGIYRFLCMWWVLIWSLQHYYYAPPSYNLCRSTRKTNSKTPALPSDWVGTAGGGCSGNCTLTIAPMLADAPGDGTPPVWRFCFRIRQSCELVDFWL